MPNSTASGSDYALIVGAEGQQPALRRHLMLVLNYRYGLDLIVANSFYEGFSSTQKYGSRIRCAAVVMASKAESKTSLSALNLDGQFPLFLLVPKYLGEHYQQLCAQMENVSIVFHEDALDASSDDSVQKRIERVFQEHGIGEIFSDEVASLPFEDMQQLIAHRLRTVKTLPTLPEVALRIMTMVEDPESTATDLEDVLTADAAIVHKLLQVVNSPLFAGSGHQGGWTLHDAIVRLGFRQVASIAQQIKLMNSLVQPEESQFDLRRFWEHCVACALIADRLVKLKLLPLKKSVPFNDYWIGALLHDCGKLILGFFFWDHFQELITQMDSEECPFRQAEKATGDIANHELLGRLLLLKSNVGEQLVEAVGCHHTTGSDPSDLTCILHVADNLAKGLGFGYLTQEPLLWSADVLSRLDLMPDTAAALVDKIGQDISERITELVDHCTAAPG
ncbi:MAG: HDOD domain-containing protein [Gemmatimonadetes bacterium]|jgi:HD-like signal output (HDOD) protein|nr:HDOD domain-containing protein [Gemmatimonadota bacterium]MBT5058927.1 HDOD domain-containing protein [Gemmatimonadota bacterium]MBT5142391.1 HDOD domain-containing protein [Gemmatimonadota bacterium]MBT5588989.1 HDOD domain-containing protein [Gemmatimonadota bacterium]MBT5962604.1 HDOD domain-containing protein [Gemmatimonadota bacterium]